MTSLNAIVVAGFLLLGFQGGPWQHHGPTDAEKEASRVKIGITKVQQQKIEAVFADMGKQEHEIRQKMRALYGELFGKVYRNYDLDRRHEETIQKEIVELYKQRVHLQTNTQAQLRKVLNREQFDRMIAQMDEKRKEWEAHRPQMGRRPGGPGGGPSRGFSGPGKQGGPFPAPGRPGGV